MGKIYYYLIWCREERDRPIRGLLRLKVRIDRVYQSLAHELAPFNVNVNAICPGLVDSERVDFIAAALVPEGKSAEEHRALRV
ncbi:MAG: hypothetical protein CM1200mP35_07810 [Chloroflexota bacterium]|nr:MAG: hypothetical protein CM1200mP35_07810 [Chloroflexota bacterium]